MVVGLNSLSLVLFGEVRSLVVQLFTTELQTTSKTPTFLWLSLPQNNKNKGLRGAGLSE